MMRCVEVRSLLLTLGDLGYEKKFSRHTPAEQTSAYLRLLDPDLGLEAGTPLGHRVCQDIGKFIPALKAIRDHRGVTVPDLGTRKGHRALAAQGKAQRGGKREKGAPSGDIWVHPDAAQARLGLNAASLERHKNPRLEARFWKCSSMFWNLPFCMCFSSAVINTHTKFEKNLRTLKKKVFSFAQTNSRSL